MVFSNCSSLNVLSWEKSVQTLYFLQMRLFKSIYIGDVRTALKMQNLIIHSSCARLLAIREVTQISINKKISGVDGQTSLTFFERFELNEFLRINVNNWVPQSLKKIVFRDKNGNLITLKVPTISDRAWHTLVTFALQPAHEAVFHPTNYGFRLSYSIYDVQNIFSLNLNKRSLGLQKRLLSFSLEKILYFFNHDFLIRKIIAPRSIKLGIFRLLKKGFSLGFEEEKVQVYSLSNLLSNVLLDGIENIHSCIRFGYSLVYFLKPFDNEKIIINKVKSFLVSLGLNLTELTISLTSSQFGFDFLGWHFKVSKNGKFLSTPSISNYQNFLKRVKHIINNSNYGSNVKANKLYPVIKEWKLYHRFSYMNSSRFSLFFVKKRAFKIFNKESKQDYYSTKTLLDRCFYIVSSSDKVNFLNTFSISPYYGHMIFWISSNHNRFDLKSEIFCIHCGMNVI
uniref:Ycf13 n=1 Tax=Euglena viridis TaxID=3040 RepID=M1EWA8_EUGVI|nr:ycf13 [Euglena viridis]AEY70774.1 ycf13 [Euglena viridis]